MTLVFIYNSYRYDFEETIPFLPSIGDKVFVPSFKRNGEPLYVKSIDWHPYPPYPEIHIMLED